MRSLIVERQRPDLTRWQRMRAAPMMRRQRGSFGQLDGATAGGIGAAANMGECIVAGGSWVAGVCIGLPGGDDEGGDVELTIPTPGTPGAVPVREENWDLGAQPYATYKIAAGDTFYGLAATYLGTGARWQEIWTTGRNRQIIPNPNMITTQGPIDMPAEARDRMIAWLKTGKQGKPGDLPKSKVEQLAKPSKAKYWVAAAIGGTALVALGVGVYAMSK